MVIAAVRYCLGRQSYIFGDCCDWIIENWPEWPHHVKRIIQRDIDEEFVRDDMARKVSREHKPLGMDMDRAQWERVRELWQCTTD
jgi:hypothetical protein